MDEGQRTMVAARIANMKRGGTGSNQHGSRAANLPVSSVSQSKAAKMLNVSERSVRDATAVIERGDPKIISLMERGRVKVTAAAEVARLPAEAQAAKFDLGNTATP